jgi:pyruvate dehydrogenase E2 component (dihydrolipoamide acetyltransferase)
VAKILAITIPKWGIEMERGTISEWRVAVGESVAKGDPLVDIETDKIVNSFEATEPGMLVRIIAQEGDELKVGTLIGVMATGPVTDAEVDAFIAAAAARSAPAPAAPAAAAARAAPEAAAVAAAAAAPAVTGANTRITPALRRKAERLGIDVRTIPATGLYSRILRDDIERAAAQRAGSGAVRNLSGAQKVIAERMVMAKQTIPHFHLHRDCPMDQALAALARHRQDGLSTLTINHLLLNAVAQALGKHPSLNLNVRGGSVETLNTIDVALAVDTGETLLTPVIRDIGAATLAQIAEAAGNAVERCKKGGISSADLQGGAVTVSNLGMLGVTSFTAIINPPQVMILAVGALQERLVMRDGSPAVERFCALTLGCDHRVINGAAGARFLADVCAALT